MNGVTLLYFKLIWPKLWLVTVIFWYLWTEAKLCPPSISFVCMQPAYIYYCLALTNPLKGKLWLPQLQKFASNFNKVSRAMHTRTYLSCLCSCALVVRHFKLLKIQSSRWLQSLSCAENTPGPLTNPKRFEERSGLQSKTSWAAGNFSGVRIKY